MLGVEVQHQIKRTLSEPQGLQRLRVRMHGADDEHRTALAERVCAQFGFVDARARVQRSSCLKALRALLTAYAGQPLPAASEPLSPRPTPRVSNPDEPASRSPAS